MAETTQFRSQQLEVVIRQITQSHLFEQGFKRRIQRPLVLFIQARHKLLAFRHTDRINEIEKLLCDRIGRHTLELRWRNGSASSALHLGVQRLGMHVIEEDQHLQWTHVRTGSNQRHRHGNTEVHVIAKRFDQLIAVPARIGDFLHELVVRATEDFLRNIDDQLRMRFGDGEDQRLRQIVEVRLSFRIKLRVDGFLVFLKDLANLVAHDNAAIQLVLVKFPLGNSNLLVLFRIETIGDGQHVASINRAAFFRELGFDAIDAIPDVHVVQHGLFVGVVRYAVVVEECKRLGNRRGRHANHASRLEVRQHLLPVAVNGAMAFVNYDEIEEIGRKSRILRQFNLSPFPMSKTGILILFGIGIHVPGQLRIETLNRTDHNPRPGLNRTIRELLDPEDFGERLAAFRQFERL